MHGPCYLGDFRYTVTEAEEVVILRYTGEDPFPVIPESIDGKPVKILGENSFLAAPVERITVPEGVERIEKNAFAACDELREVILPGSLSCLGPGVFQGSEQLETVTVSENNRVFETEEGILYNPGEKKLVFSPPGLELTDFMVPFGIRTIGDCAFYANRKLERVTLPPTLRRIETGAFLFTSAMKIISLPPYLEEIESGVFLVGSGAFAEKAFMIYAFPDTVGYRYAQENGIMVSPLYAIVTD